VTEHKSVWVVTDFGFPKLPSVRQHRLIRMAKNNHGVIVRERGVDRHLPPAGYRTFCFTEARAAEVCRGIVQKYRQKAAAVVAEIATALTDGLPVEVVHPDVHCPSGPLKLV
jgi:hypothetical protein